MELRVPVFIKDSKGSAVPKLAKVKGAERVKMEKFQEHISLNSFS
jgi:hypothetical protein